MIRVGPNVAAFSIDIDSEDFKIKKPDVLVGSTMAKLKKNGKGIILMHDLHKWTALAVPELLAQLKANGYKVVHVRAKDTLDTLPKYDAIVAAAQEDDVSGEAFRGARELRKREERAAREIDKYAVHLDKTTRPTGSGR